MGLMLHCGSKSRTLEEIRQIPTPPPVRSEGSEKRKGQLFVPIAHDFLYDSVVGELEKSTCFRVADQNFGVSEDGQKFFGLIQVRNGHNADDHSLVMGIRNSHDQTFSSGLVIGSHVFVCDNLAFSGEIKIARKHTANILRDLPALIFSAIGQVKSAVDFQTLRFEAYKNTPLDNRDADHVLMNAWREGVLSSRTLTTAREEWDNPSHEEFAPRNLWSLFNDCTEAFKGKGGRILNGIDRETLNLHNFMDRQVGLESYEDFCKRINAEFEVEDEEENENVIEADYAMLN